jgi:hypothetical protein
VSVTVALTVTAPPAARADEPPPCAEAVGPETAQAVFDGIMAVQGADGCALADVSTLRTRIEVTWSKAGAGSLPAAVVAPSACTPGATPVPRQLAATVPAALRDACPTATRALDATLAARALPPVIALPAPERAVTAGERRVQNALPVAASAALLLSLVAMASLLASVLRPAPDRAVRRARIVGAALFVVGLGLRLAIPASPSNWYVEALAPASGGAPAAGRFGPGAFAWEALLRAVLPWRESTLMRAQEVAGAAMIPLAFALCLALAIPLEGAAAAALLLAVAPLHVRASASPSEHVIAATFTLALFVLWHRGVRRARPLDLALCLPLAAAVVLTRVDAWPFLVAVPLLPAVVDARAGERLEAGAVRRARRLAAVYVAAWLALGAAAYLAIVVPSNHPGPTRGDVLRAATGFLSQYVEIAAQPPHWYAPVAVALAAVGVAVLAARRRMLLLRVVACLALAFVPVGRLLSHDGLLGARYFLATLPFSLLPAGVGFAALLDLAVRRLPAARAPLVRAGAFAALAIAAVVPALGAYRHRYTFQDEQAWLAGALESVAPGCTVATLPVRRPAFGIDLDGSLDVARSTLPLARPDLAFVTLPLEAPAEAAPPAECVAYYESSACSIQQTPEVRARFGAALDWYGAACPAMRAITEPAPFASAEVSASATNDLFGGVPPHVSLRWWRRPGP